MMKIVWEKGIFTAIGTWIGTRLNLLFPGLLLLTLLMIADYISGMLASKKEALEHSDDKEYGWSSKKNIIGIYKKAGYILTILAAVSTDYVLYKFAGELGIEFPQNTIFGLLVTVWFIINELLSILENAGRMGAELPGFLKNVLADMRNKVEKK